MLPLNNFGMAHIMEYFEHVPDPQHQTSATDGAGRGGAGGRGGAAGGADARGVAGAGRGGVPRVCARLLEGVVVQVGVVKERVLVGVVLGRDVAGRGGGWK